MPAIGACGDRRQRSRPRCLNVLALALLIIAAGCANKLKSVTPARGVPGETVTLHGSGFHNGGTLWKAPRLSRCDDTDLEVLSSTDTEITVRIPAGMAAGRHLVYAYGEPKGAYEPAKTNALNFWVTAASVPAAVTDNYEVQVKSFRAKYGKSATWESWMLANRTRYVSVFDTSWKAPCPINFAVSYLTPITYNPPWSSEAEHMTALRDLAAAAYPGYRFDFSLSLDPAQAYAKVQLGLQQNLSNAAPGYMQLHFEGIFVHEFAHVFTALHHYDGADIGTGLHFPPDEPVNPGTNKPDCVMDRSGSQFCSACRTAMNIPLDLQYGAAVTVAVTLVNSHQPVF